MLQRMMLFLYLICFEINLKKNKFVQHRSLHRKIWITLNSSPSHRCRFNREEDKLSAARPSKRRWRATRVRLWCRTGPVHDVERSSHLTASLGSREPPQCSADVVGLFRSDSPLHLNYCTGAPATNPQSHSNCLKNHLKNKREIVTKETKQKDIDKNRNWVK